MSNVLNIDYATNYAKKVCNGDIVAGLYVRLACQRHLDDLENGSERGLAWDIDKANHAIGFFKSVLTITAGNDEGKAFELLEYQKFIVGSLYGWVYKETGFLRFREAWIETGKGQAKSPLMAGLGLKEMLSAEKAEVYVMAQEKRTAKVCFMDAVNMCRAPIPNAGKNATLENIGAIITRGTLSNTYKIEHPQTKSVFDLVAVTDAISGPRPRLVLIDEVHELKEAKAIDFWRAACGKVVGNSLLVLSTNTPPVDKPVPTEFSQANIDMLNMLTSDDKSRNVEVDGVFAYIARVDIGDKPLEDDRCWAKSLPAIDALKMRFNVSQIVGQAKIFGNMIPPTERLYFGIPAGSSGSWIARDLWVNVCGDIDNKEIAGCPLHLSLDLSDRHDLTALSGCWVLPNGKLRVKTWYWTCSGGITGAPDQKKLMYQSWEKRGFITIVDDSIIDFDYVARQVQDIFSKNKVVQMAIDSAKFLRFQQSCKDIGFSIWVYDQKKRQHGFGLKVVRHKQGCNVSFDDRFLDMPKSVEALEDAILSCRKTDNKVEKDGLHRDIIIENNPITNMCAANAVLKNDAQNNKAFAKDKSQGSIDGVVTIAMAVGSAMSEKRKGQEFNDYMKYIKNMNNE